MSSLSDIHKTIERLVEDRLRTLSGVLDLDVDRVLEENRKLSKEVTLKKKKNKDPNKPKQPDNSYLLFTRDCRAITNNTDTSALFPKSLRKTVESAVKELKSQSEDGNLSSKMFTKRLGLLWKSKDMEKHKKAYEDEAARKREAYKKECTAYEGSSKAEATAHKKVKAEATKATKSKGKADAPKAKGKKAAPKEAAEEEAAPPAKEAPKGKSKGKGKAKATKSKGKEKVEEKVEEEEEEEVAVEDDE